MPKRLLKKVILIMSIILIACGAMFVIYATTQERIDIVCNDINFYNALKNELPNNILITTNNETKTISIPEDILNGITTLTLKNSNISDLTGLENFTNLIELNLSNNDIGVLTPLNNLTSLTKLNLSDNSSIGNNIAPLSNKTSLIELNLSSDGISSVTSLSGLINIQKLDISNNNINNLSPLAGLNGLEILNVSNNQNLSTLDHIKTHNSLEELNISGTAIDNLGDMENHTGIQTLTKLKVLNVRGLKNIDLSPITDTYYSELDEKTYAYLSKLESLDISYTDGIDFSNLEYLTNISELYMLGNNIYSVYGIAKLENLRYVNLEENNITDIDGFIETETNENGQEVIVRKLRAKEIVLKNNQISSILDLHYLDDIDYLDVSYNMIVSVAPIENKTLSKGLHVEHQNVNIEVYKKTAEVDQYIILPNIMQQSKNPNSKIYAQNAQWNYVKTRLNPDTNYQESGLYNIIIDYDKTEEDEISVTLTGGAASGTVINYRVTQNGSAADSLVFEDDKLCEAIYNSLLRQKSEDSILLRALHILNIEQQEISDITRLDVSGYEIRNLRGLESFGNLEILNASSNAFNTIEPLKYCTNIKDLNVSNSQIADNNGAIIQMKYLTNLDLSNTGMTNINNLNTLIESYEENEEIPSINSLNISKNNIRNINGLEKLTELQSLYMANNQIIDISKLNTLTKLQTANVSSNKITDISAFRNINTLRTLNISNNQIVDISPIYTGITALYFSGNKVKDITPLSRMTSLTDLVMSNNRIENISSIQGLLINHEFLMEQQEINKTLEKNATGRVTIELPQIFIAAKEQGSKVYTAQDFETNNCTINENLVIINVDELGDNSASVRIAGGTARGTTLMIAKPIEGTVTYAPDALTNQNVTATISFNKESISIKNNDGSNKKIFEQNGEFTFEFEDENGFKGEETAVVNWIDKTKPVLTKEEASDKTSVEVVITANEKIQAPTGWELSNNQMSILKTYTSTTAETVIVKDLAGNETSIDISITIDKDPPVITGVKNQETYSHSVTPIITDDDLGEITLTRNGEIVEGYTSGREITEEGNYVLTAKDNNDNAATVSFEIKFVVSNNIESNQYTVDEESLIISNITPETTVSDLKQKIQSQMEYQIKDKDGNDLREDSNLGTGCKIVMQDGKTYEIAVLGDLNGDAKISITDVARLQKIVVGLREESKLEKLASDFNNDNKLSLVDVAKLQKIATGIINL